MLLFRYRTEESRKTAETICRLHQFGYTYQEIADKTGKSVQHVIKIIQREQAFRCEAFQSPFVEYLGPRTVSAIKKSLSVNALSDPESLSNFESVSSLLCWPGVGDAVLSDLAAGLEEAGYESFDLEAVKKSMYHKDKRFRRHFLG